MASTGARVVVKIMALADEALDEILYRPAVVRAFRWLPRWWLCDLAKASMRLDDRWQTGYWDNAWMAPGPPCAACRRRASIHVVDGPAGEEVGVCGWCHLEGPVNNRADFERELAAAAANSVAWRWRPSHR